MPRTLPGRKGGPIPFEEALDIVRRSAAPLEAEKVPLALALGRVLRQDVVSDMAMPPFDKSAMDGFACRRSDLPGPFEVVETIPAGRPPTRTLAQGQAAKIMTGAMLPEGADCVFVVEEAEALPDRRVRHSGRKTADNICRKGSDVSPGQLLVAAGARITPKAVSSLALAGCVEPLVSRKPVVGVLATGDEIVAPSERPGGAQIRDTNSIQTLCQAAQCGCDTRSYGIVRDDAAAISAALARGAAECDVLIVTGGVSMGDFDLVPGALREAGFELLFEKVAAQPGKPTVFGRRGASFVFGMPGNPVSCFIVFEFLVKELLARMTGLSERPAGARLPLAAAVRRSRADRLARIPVRVTPAGLAEAVPYHGSAHVTSLAGADGVISMPVGVASLEEGDLVDVRPI
ncbi:MAG: molybdopterin molybdotransferase MoeA [Elusimicrobia bacterium]|nr:molybdopterin molybdotransferase MoeA [Elusimicrobiota bacterium]